MNLLRSLLLLLVCAVPATALAGVLHQGTCQRGAPATSAPHVAHAMQGEHSMHAHHQMAQAASDSGQSSGSGSCQCGCTCGGIAHCGAGAAASAGDSGPAVPNLGRESSTPMAESGHAMAGHPHDFLRPPSMS
ncbi:MAG: hypothetical protein VYC42_16145 [Pseudomonadota bacterium]|nr:hypothetical protein [Pseudomonadota bacterium]